ncbi:MAG: hypothetical protein U1F76_13815 [Candidatus Competibacteraceae bacterium]
MKNINLAVSLVATFLLTACNGETDQERKAKDKAADANQSPVISCDWQDMYKQRLNVLSWADEADVCITMQAALGRMPSVALVRKLSKAIFVMQVYGSKETAKDIAYQMMNIVEAREKEKSDKMIDSTFETVTKIFNITQGHVTPKDINILLRSAGPMAKTLSEDGIVSMAAIIWENKKAYGE